MTQRTKLILIAVLLAVVATVAMWYLRADYAGICTKGDRNCYDVFDAITQVLFLIALGVAPILFVLSFLPKDVFTAWFKFARVFIPIAIVLAVIDAFTYSESNYLGMTGSGTLAFILITTYIIASLILIIRAHRRLKRQQNPKLFPTGGQKPA